MTDPETLAFYRWLYTQSEDAWKHVYHSIYFYHGQELAEKYKNNADNQQNPEEGKENRA